jgi:RNA polymerase sigma factor (sigma-70 family)
MENKFNNITEKTTLGELLAILHLGEKPGKTPTPRELRETVGDPAATEERCLVYRNGWAVYDNGSGCTVLWLPDCVSFTYQFIKPEKNESWAVPACEKLPESLLPAQPWPIAVTLLGDYSVERNLMKRKGSSCSSIAIGESDCDFTEETIADSVLECFFRQRERVAEDPEDFYIWKETLQEMLDSMTKKQRKAFVLYYIYGYKEEEIARRYCVKKAAVCRLLSRAVEEAKKKI